MTAFAGRSLAAYKRSRMVRFAGDLPKTSPNRAQAITRARSHGLL
jgi:hypothetical protein